MDFSRILVSGVSGPIGAALLPSLNARGYKVTRLMRGSTFAEGQVPWDPMKPVAPESVSGFDAVIHLAGETIVGRWTDTKKRHIRDSRVLGTRHLAEALALAPRPPQVLISGSAIGYYGNRGNEILRETSPMGKGFLPQVSRDWEAATEPATRAGIRTVLIRTGLVLSPDGGALQKMLPPFRLGVGGNMGNGRQWWSWIHVQDMVDALHHTLKNEVLYGPVNLVSPTPATNAEFTKTLASVLSRPAIFPLPAFVARIAFGQMGEELLLASQRVEPGKLIASGYAFQYSNLRKALEAILKN